MIAGSRGDAYRRAAWGTAYLRPPGKVAGWPHWALWRPSKRSTTQLSAAPEKDSEERGPTTLADFNDLVRPVARAGGTLAVPANDWKGVVEQLHHQSSVWPVVMAQVPIVRSTGHGVSALYDAAGRVLALPNSFDSPVVLVADVPITKRATKASRDRTLLADDIQKASPEAAAAV